jgi:hypothetical protein
MKAKLTLSVDRDLLTKARRKLSKRKRTISAEVDALLARIAGEQQPERKSWSEQFGDLVIPLDMKEAESDTPHGRQLRKTGAYRQAKAVQRKARK